MNRKRGSRPAPSNPSPRRRNEVPNYALRQRGGSGDFKHNPGREHPRHNRTALWEAGMTENTQQDLANKNITQIIYGLYAASIIVGVTYFVGIVLNYVKRDDVRGTWLESHFTWQIRTFWYSLLWFVVGFPLIAAVGLGFVVWVVAGIWYIYRIVKGWLRLSESKPMYT
jgi:uncharacterized membrane protein